MSIRATGENYEQPADIVILGALCASTTRCLMLYSGIGTPYDPVDRAQASVGKNYCYQYTGAGVSVFFEDKEINPFMASGRVRHRSSTISTATISTTRRLGFIGGGSHLRGPVQRRGRSARVGAAGHAASGAASGNSATAKWYGCLVSTSAAGACNYAHRDNYLDLDPTYKDALGRAADPHDVQFQGTNDAQDRRVPQSEIGVEIARAMNPTHQ